MKHFESSEIIKEMLKEAYNAGYCGNIELMENEINTIYDKFIKIIETETTKPKTYYKPVSPYTFPYSTEYVINTTILGSE